MSDAIHIDRRRALLFAKGSIPHDTAQQFATLRGVAGQRGWCVVREVVADRRTSGATITKEITTGLLGNGVVLVVSLSGLGDSMRQVVQVLRELRAHGVDLVAVADHVDSIEPAARMCLDQMVEALLSVERDGVRRRAREALLEAQRRGVTIGRPRAQVPLAQARELMRGGMGLRQAARALHVPASTLSRALRATPEPPAVTATVLREVA